MSKSRSFSIYLLKEGFDATNALRQDHTLDAAVTATGLPDASTLFVLDGEPRPPWWRSYFGIEQPLSQMNIRKDALQIIVDKYADFSDLYKDIDGAAKLVKGKLDEFQSRIWDNLFDLLSFQVPNRYEVTYHGKALKSHSLGQRASAMMLFLLSQEGNDLLLVDQPEDDLDSQTVYEEVVKLVRKLKVGRQFIFATHDANFPVLGDAEIVASCEATDVAIAVMSGSIDSKDSQSKIVRIMEGGVEAFDRRKAIYQIWKAG